MGGYLWSRDSKYILFVKDNAGDENFNVYAVDPGAETAPGADAPPSRDLTNLKGVRLMMFSAPKSDPDVLYIGLNDRDKSWHDLYKLKISTGERTLIRKNTDRIAGWIFDLQGNLRLAQRVKDSGGESGDQELLRVDAGGFTPIYTCSVFESADVIQFHRDGQRAYIQTNKGALDLLTLALLDPATGQVENVESDPLGRVDLDAAWFSEDTDELVVTRYSDDRDRRYFKDPAFEADFKWLEKNSRQGNFGPFQHARREPVADRRARRYRARRNVPVRPHNARALVSIQDPREIAARVAGADAGSALPVVRRPGNPRVLDPAQRRGSQSAAGASSGARRSLGAR